MKTIFHVQSRGTVPEGGAQAVRDFLQESYDGNLRIGGCHRAPSEWWRNELEFLPEHKPDRWVTRVHLFEDGPCVHGRYVGYAHLRPRGLTTPPPELADAFLAPPLRMFGPNYSIPSINLTELSQIYGEPHFCCLPYAMPVRDLGGLCAHACLYMATLMMVPYDSRPIGPLDVTLQVALKDTTWGPRIEPAVPISAKGLKPEESLKLLRGSGACAWGQTLGWNVEEFPVNQFLTLLRQYVEAGLPVMLHVDFGKLYRRPIPPGEERHAVLLVGVGRTNGGESLFVYHDSVVGPYREVTWPVLAESLYLFKDKDSDQRNYVVAIAVSPGGAHPPPDDQDGKDQAPLSSPPVRYPVGKCHKENDHESVEWHLELLPRQHFYRRVTRMLVANFSARARLREVAESVAVLFPENELPAYMWLLSRSVDAHQPGSFCFLYDSTWRENQKARRIGRLYVEVLDEICRNNIQQGVGGYGSSIFERDGTVMSVRLDPSGKEVRA